LKALLVNPPVLSPVLDNTPSVIEEGRGATPPLGLMYLAAYLEAYSDHQVEIIDAQVEENGLSAVENRIRTYRPDVVGITAMTMILLDVVGVVELIKRVQPSIRVVVGGPHAHLFPEETARLTGVDFVIQGEGEEAFKELLDHIDDVAQLGRTPGVAFLNADELVNVGPRAPIENLDALPFPARHLVPQNRYSSVLAKRDPVTTLFTSRGCPFKCTFCDRPHLGKRFRARSGQNVVDEIETCTDRGIHQFLIYDDTFTVNKQRVLDICAQIRRRGLDIGFDIRARVDTVDEEMLKDLKAAGCEGIHYGVESGSERVLRTLKKGIDLDHTRRIFNLTRERGIASLAYFMIGNPGETLRDVEMTFALMKRLDPDYVHITVLTPFPGTRIYEDGLRCGLLEGDTWRAFAEKPDPAFQPPFWSEFFSRKQLDDLLVKGYRQFYLRPSYIARRTVRLRSVGDLKKKVRAGLRVLGMRGLRKGAGPDHRPVAPEAESVS
jgi:anaerobic magnesium-protoporphyrin IX monomethyl ester cyclase